MVVCFFRFPQKQCRHHNLKKGCSIVSQNGILVNIMGNMVDFFFYNDFINRKITLFLL